MKPAKSYSKLRDWASGFDWPQLLNQIKGGDPTTWSAFRVFNDLERVFPKLEERKLKTFSKSGFFLGDTHAGYIDIRNPTNSYYMLHGNLMNPLSRIPNSLDLSTWNNPQQHILNSDGNYSYAWGGGTLYDITHLILRQNYFLNWVNENPLEVKE